MFKAWESNKKKIDRRSRGYRHWIVQVNFSRIAAEILHHLREIVGIHKRMRKKRKWKDTCRWGRLLLFESEKNLKSKVDDL